VSLNHNSLKSKEDVGNWLESFNDTCAIYADSFIQNEIDGFWLLNHVNEENLVNYGVKDKSHQRLILSHIKELKNELLRETSTKNN
jgi:hypothetical protein